MQLTLKKFALASLLSVASFSAYAADVVTNLGNITVPGAASYGNIKFADGLAFFDSFYFSIPTSGLTAAVTFSSKVGNFTGLSNLSALIYGGNTVETGAVVANTFASALGTTTNLGGGIEVTTVSLNTVSLAAGLYTLQIRGSVLNGAANGAYYGTLSVNAVPEADTYAMLIAGLGLIGGVTRRKSKV